jgi:PTH1 family peptidyl-tRNA hydrolase
MKLIVGLGNPGERYAQTRHNVGFMAVDQFATRAGLSWREGHRGLWVKTKAQDQELCLLKPMTYMNLSGESVLSLAMYFKIDAKDILVLHDEVEFPFGDVRLKIGGGEAGHNGLKSISQQLKTKNYSRVRIGVGRPSSAHIDMADYVLQNFSKAEEKGLEDVLIRCNEAIDAFNQGHRPFQLAMNQFNKGISKE